MANIKLHPDYGLNPTIPICIWCNKDKNEIVMLGSAYKGEAPMHMVLDNEPCQECQDVMSQGVTLIELRSPPENGKKPDRTGSWAVIKDDAVYRIFSPETAAAVVKRRKGYVAVGVLAALGIPEPEKG